LKLTIQHIQRNVLVKNLKKAVIGYNSWHCVIEHSVTNLEMVCPAQLCLFKKCDVQL